MEVLQRKAHYGHCFCYVMSENEDCTVLRSMLFCGYLPRNHDILSRILAVYAAIPLEPASKKG